MKFPIMVHFNFICHIVTIESADVADAHDDDNCVFDFDQI